MPDEPSEEITIVEIDQACSEIVVGLDGIPDNDQFGYLQGRLAALKPKLRDAVEPLILKACSISKRDTVTQTRNQMRLWEKITILVLGLILLATVYITAFKVPSPTIFQKNVFCVVLGLAAAATGAILPGFIRIESKTGEYWVRAGGAFALLVFVLIFFCR